MINIKIVIVSLVMIALIPCFVHAQGIGDMMNQYKEMNGDNFPQDLEKFVPQGCVIKSKTFVYTETQNMFLSIGMNLTKKNDIYPKFGLETEIEIGVFGYNPKTAGYMASTWPILQSETKNRWRMDGESSSGGWDYEPVRFVKLGLVDVNIQKGTRKNVEIDERKYEDQIYYIAEAMMFDKNMMLKIRIVNYPLKSDQVNAMIKEIADKFIATKWEAYMK